MKVIYSYNKEGYEGERWATEISAASSEDLIFIPLNHGEALDPGMYSTAERLDMLYRSAHPGLMALYRKIAALIASGGIDALLVANCPPYHPDFLKKLPVYKALYSADDPGSTYLINIPYLHAYDHVFFVDPVYSRDMDMAEKMRYCGMANADWLPISVFDFECDPSKSEEGLFSRERDIDIIYVGKFWKQKMPAVAAVRKAFGRRFRMHGLFRTKHNIYMNVKYGFGGWVRPVSHEERVELYQRSKIGFNIHWDGYGLGNQRLYHLPANGVMQISDCEEHLGRIFEPGKEVIGYRGADDLVAKIKYYLEHDSERQKIAKEGYLRTMREYRFGDTTRRAGALIREGMDRIGGLRASLQ